IHFKILTHTIKTYAQLVTLRFINSLNQTCTYTPMHTDIHHIRHKLTLTSTSNIHTKSTILNHSKHIDRHHSIIQIHKLTQSISHINTQVHSKKYIQTHSNKYNTYIHSHILTHSTYTNLYPLGLSHTQACTTFFYYFAHYDNHFLTYS
ncbi:hypothetical protein PanWU01x14_357140, partial [Parasponia andersonii]